jgi:hypothetical protein
MTQTAGALLSAIIATALVVAGMNLSIQKTAKATLIDASSIGRSGVLMIFAQGIL